MESDSEEEKLVVDHDATRCLVVDRDARRNSRTKKSLLFVGVVCLVGGAMLFLPKARAPYNVNGTKDSMEQKSELLSVVPSGPACSKAGENCLSSGCCKVSGHRCYEKTPGFAQCNESCYPGQDGFSCNRPQGTKQAMPVVYHPGTSMYCFSVYTQNTGTTKKSWELDLLKTQLRWGASIFGCPAWDVYSDVHVELSPGPPDPLYTVQVHDKYNEFHQTRRAETGAWVNWGMFFQVWWKIRENGRWHDQDYTVKVDPDAVFLPQRLVNWLNGRKVTEHGVYYENCKNVEYGFFGNLEVYSQKAVAVYTANLEECHQELGACAATGCDWKWGPWGEDVFAQRCMDRHHVEKVEAFDLTTDGACPADRPDDQKLNKKWHATDCWMVTTPAIHPFKTPEDWFGCLGQIMHIDY